MPPALSFHSLVFATEDLQSDKDFSLYDHIVILQRSVEVPEERGGGFGKEGEAGEGRKRKKDAQKWSVSVSLGTITAKQSRKWKCKFGSCQLEFGVT